MVFVSQRSVCLRHSSALGWLHLKPKGIKKLHYPRRPALSKQLAHFIDFIVRSFD